jgi:WXG100 family type VII secretion target
MVNCPANLGLHYFDEIGRSMGKDMRVDPVTLRASAGEVDVSADDLRAQHGSAHERIAAAQAGWIGASAAALTAKAAQWEKESATHYTELVKHGHHFRSAAASYLETDSEAGAEIDNAGSNLGNLGL